ncbi:MAG: 50S ribosomal protein L10 [Bacilli bacterium]|nr:50S ribosomal protein L10 [Bacilli bacterium]MDD4282428.1 50S ribosomal protein L10 [Bacilli bacterium]MDD4718898.1 50S ribosomal protein L10 [Bacilli bacterium]
MANQKVLEKKQEIIEEISQNLSESQSVVFFEYDGLTVVELTELRRTLRENDSEFKVYKNTLAKRALKDLKIDLSDHLVGQKAMAFGKDAVAPIKVLSDFSKKHKSLEMKVGIVEGNITNIDALTKLAKIPSREGLLTMVAAGMMGTIRNLSICLDLYSQKLEK